MNKEILSPILFSGENSISPGRFAFSIFLSFLLSFLLSNIYRRESNSFSNPETLARILPILSIGTTMIIAVVKSSLALSLGLVGALSIVRFRTPIKEPEELTYIFLCIGIGLATGADQYKIALIGFTLTTLCIFLNKKLTSRKKDSNTISISISRINTSDISKVLDLISRNSLYVNFHNLSSKNEENSTNLTLSFVPKDFNQIKDLANEIQNLFPSSTLNIIDNNVF